MRVNYTFRIDEDVKKDAEALFAEMGMSLSTAFNIFLRQSIRERQIPFRITAGEPNEETYAAIADAENGRDLHGPFASVSDLMEALDAED